MKLTTLLLCVYKFCSPTSLYIYNYIYILNLRTELFRPLWTRQRSTEEMRPNLIAMEIQISNQVRTYLARVLELTSQWALHNANSKGTTPRKSAQLPQEQERNTQSADRTVSSFVDSSAQHRGNEVEPDSNGNKNFQSGPNVPCQSARTDKSVSSA